MNKIYYNIFTQFCYTIAYFDPVFIVLQCGIDTISGRNASSRYIGSEGIMWGCSLGYVLTCDRCRRHRHAALCFRLSACSGDCKLRGGCTKCCKEIMV